MTLYMLDTNTVSYIISGRSAAARLRLSRTRAGTVAVSAITEAELSYGIARRQLGPDKRDAIRLFLDKSSVLPFGRQEAMTYGLFRARQESVGKPLAPLDTMIAAHAIAAGAVLVSRDSAFRNVPGLRVEDWATDL